MRAAWLFLLPLAPLAQAPPPPVERLADVALAFAKVEAAKLGGEHSFKVAQPPRVPATRPGSLSFEASHLSKREPVGHFFVVVAIKVDGDRVGMTRVDLHGSWVGSVLRAKGDLARQTDPDPGGSRGHPPGPVRGQGPPDRHPRDPDHQPGHHGPQPGRPG